MDSLQALNAIKNILDNANRVKQTTSCILIDGSWGIGKTHLIDNLFSQDSNYELIHISLFGKNSIKEIENLILINLIPGIKSIKNPSRVTKFIGTLGKDIFSKIVGLNIEDYLKLFSIEDFKNNKDSGKRKVICIDDLERKSDKIDMRDLLGIIERATVNFDVILLANLREIEKKESEVLDTYKEKVIDNVIKIDKLNKMILKQILEDIAIEGKEEIIEVYLENLIFGKSPSSFKGYLTEDINNLRIFIKYVELVLLTMEHISIERLDQEVLRMCKAVVCDYYFPDKDKKKESMNFDRFNIYNTLKKILLFEDFTLDSFDEYFIQISEVRRDIKTLYNLYELNEKDLKILIDKIDEHIHKNSNDYFLNQENIISLISALEESDILDRKRYKGLLYIAISMYLPQVNSRYKPFMHTSWNNHDMYGYEIECNERTKSFIEELNNDCIGVYKQLIDQKIAESKKTKNYDEMLKLINYDEIDNLEEFEEVFDYYFNQLSKRYSNNNQEKIERLIHRTNSEIIKNFFISRIRKENLITNRKRYEYFEDILVMKMNNEAQHEYYMDNPDDQL